MNGPTVYEYKRLVDVKTSRWCLILVLAMSGVLWAINVTTFLAMAIHNTNPEALHRAQRTVCLFACGGMVCLAASAWAIWSMYRHMTRRMAIRGLPQVARRELRVVPALILVTLSCFVAAFAVVNGLPVLWDIIVG